MMFGRKGQWAQIVNLVLVVLLPKNSGGRRPFGSFLTIFRSRRLWDGGTVGSLARSV